MQAHEGTGYDSPVGKLTASRIRQAEARPAEIHHSWEGRADLLADLRSAAEKVLSPSLFRVFCLAFLEGMDNDEGAEIMGYKDSGVFRKKKSQCLSDLRQYLEPAGYLRLALEVA